MPLSRRQLLSTSSVSLASAQALLSTASSAKEQTDSLKDWNDVAAMFDLDPAYAHLSMFFIASTPRPVKDRIASFRTRIDANPYLTVEHGLMSENLFGKSAEAIARYIGAKANDIALTHNTTGALSTLYAALPLRDGDDILTTAHEHMVHHESIRLAAQRCRGTWQKIPLWDSWDSLSAEQISERVLKNLRANTRVVGLTWVHSQSGARMPIRAIADGLAKVNKSRDAKDRVLLIVDGVHGLGVEDPKITSLGVDAFAAGLHKWMLGPRGTGFLWAKPDVWPTLRQLTPAMAVPEHWKAWMQGKVPSGPAKATWFMPSGFQAFEHFWSIPAAIELHEAIGPARVTERIHSLAQSLNDELRKLPNITQVYTPKKPTLNAGIVCFEVKGMPPEAVVKRLLDKKVIASTTPYAPTFARLSCGLMNSAADVERALREIRTLS